VVVVAGVAFAASKLGTQAGDTLNGTEESDTLVGAQGADVINGRMGNDFLYGDSQNDQVNGNPGDDFIWLDSGSADVGNGGAGDDSIFAADGTGGDTVDGGETEETVGDFCVVDAGDTVVPNSCEDVDTVNPDLP
jgi:Ca2+-binding RTX toxin-like protein